MNESPDVRVRRVVDEIYRQESRRVFATLIRLLGDFDLAEDALHDAFSAALIQWTRDGIPANPRSWLISTGKFQGIDVIRRRAKFNASLGHLAEQIEIDQIAAEDVDDQSVEDDRLRLILICCNPALSPEARVALTLREVCGLTTEEIARCFLTTTTTLAQRIVRAKTKIRTAHIPYKVPSQEELPERLETVRQVIYLVFTEGYAASQGESLTRADLSGEAIRLARLLIELQPDPETEGLLALMLLQESRRKARTTPSGDLILLEEQDRTLWNQEQIAEGKALVEHALSSRRFGVYTVQASIAALHAEPAHFAETDWPQIVALYQVLMQMAPSPVVELNWAVAASMCNGLLVGLEQIESILARGDLSDYHLAHSAKAELCRRLGRLDEARISYERALSLVQQEPERRFLMDRLHMLEHSAI